MSTTTDGWTEQVSWNEVRYVHAGDDSMIQRLDMWPTRPWALYMGDPPTFVDAFPTPEDAMTAHASDMADRAEARELRRSKT